MNTKKLKSVLSHYGIIFVLVLLIIVFASLSNRFLMPNNIFNIPRQSSIVGLFLWA